MKKLGSVGALMLVVLMGVIMNGCSNGSGAISDYSNDNGAKPQKIDFTIVYENMNTGLAQNRESLVNTFAEWETIRSVNDAFNELDAKINDNFFVVNSLVVYAFTRNWAGLKAEVTEVHIMGNELVVNVAHIDGDMTIQSHGIVVIEIVKEDIRNVSSLRIVSKNNDNGSLELDPAMEAELRRDYFNQFVKPIDNDAKLEDVQILKYCGNFDGVVVVRFDRPAYGVITTIQVGGVDFIFNNSNVAIVWHDGNFFELQEAYENGLLSIANLTYVAGKLNQ